MRLSSLCAGVPAASLLAPGVAAADVFEDYQDLSQRRLSPAPLVFTSGTPSNYYGGGVHATLVPLDGSGFSVDTARSSEWSGTVSGTTAPGSITVTIHATGTFAGNACMAGPVTFKLIPIPIR